MITKDYELKLNGKAIYSVVNIFNTRFAVLLFNMLVVIITYLYIGGTAMSNFGTP